MGTGFWTDRREVSGKSTGSQTKQKTRARDTRANGGRSSAAASPDDSLCHELPRRGLFNRTDETRGFAGGQNRQEHREGEFRKQRELSATPPRPRAPRWGARHRDTKTPAHARSRRKHRASRPRVQVCCDVRGGETKGGWVHVLNS